MKNFQMSLNTVKGYVLSKYQLCFLFTTVSLFHVTAAFAQGDPAEGEGAAVQLVNPLKINSIEELLTTILGVVIILAAPVIVFFIIYAGFLYVTARGNAEQITQANRALTYAIIGGVIIIGSVAIATIIKNIVMAF